MTDIVERLRKLGHPKDWHSPGHPMNGWVSAYEAQAIGKAAADEIERLRAANAAWMNGVADAVEPLGYGRGAACGPADLLPGLRDLHAIPPGTWRVTVHDDGTIDLVLLVRPESVFEVFSFVDDEDGCTGRGMRPRPDLWVDAPEQENDR